MIYYFGLAADPITHSHLAIIKTIHKLLKKDDELYIGISNNDEKKYHTTLDERFIMVHDALSDKFKKNAPALLKQDKRTLAFLEENFNGQEKDITIVVGEDEWKSLLEGRWECSGILLSTFKFIVVGRENSKVDTKNYKATVVNIKDNQDISSSAVREVLYSDPNCHYSKVSKFITRQTFHSIKENSLYKQNSLDYDEQEKKYLKKYAVEKKKNNWGEPSVTTDIVAYNLGSVPQVLLIRRKNFPYKGYWATPGGFFEKTDLDLNYGAAREFREETSLNIDPKEFKQIKAYGHNFDPRMKIVDIAYCVEISKKDMKTAVANDDACEVGWFRLDNLPELAFHHKQIIEDFIKFKDIKL